METIITIKHRALTIDADFKQFNKKMVSLLGAIGKEDFDLIKSHPEIAQSHLRSLGGFEDLILFGVQEHGALLRLDGQNKNAIQYILGNPLIALQMTRHDVRAALYAPLRILVYETATGQITIEYDLPSTLFGQFGNPEILEIGLLLDQKLEKLVNESVNRSVR
ncbi:DUF302 domain-containing protein [Mucilaginibacter rubeus]|uniref:DUF302 domain-containing protein n=1 Tax=Mucilaginibacter rubeus TaxID=2027860 RepID=UPI0016639828|nr:DUF302 domain-containing protein [Mucilaginibacter rubeus]GGA96120.1 hypothetical protein GCM10011500_09880 [Mucilaginibacter rubeus]